MSGACLKSLGRMRTRPVSGWMPIESDVVSSLKGSLAASAGVAPDAPPVETAAQQVETFFKEFRDSLEKE